MYGHRARIGYTSPPAVTEVFPCEFYRIVPDGVTLAVRILPLVERTSDEVDQGYDASLRAAHAMARARVDVLVLGGLPINISRGYANADDLIADVSAEICLPVISSFSAQQDVFAVTGAEKVAIVQPYTPDHAERFSGYVERMGATPLAVESLGSDFIGLGRLPGDRVRAAAEEALSGSPGADTLYVPCPHYATAHVIDVVEREFGVTVIAALQAIVWRALRTCGVQDRIDGFGRLFTPDVPASA